MGGGLERVGAFLPSVAILLPRNDVTTDNITSFSEQDGVWGRRVKSKGEGGSRNTRADDKGIDFGNGLIGSRRRGRWGGFGKRKTGRECSTGASIITRGWEGTCRAGMERVRVGAQRGRREKGGEDKHCGR